MPQRKYSIFNPPAADYTIVKATENKENSIIFSHRYADFT